jgi:hypothetical protein
MNDLNSGKVHENGINSRGQGRQQGSDARKGQDLALMKSDTQPVILSEGVSIAEQ